MNITDLFSAPGCERLIMTFAHFLWQGLAIAVVVTIAGLLFRRSSAQARYSLFAAALLLLAFCPPLTFWLLGSGQPAIAERNRLPNMPESFAESTIAMAESPGTLARKQIVENTGEAMIPRDSQQPALTTVRAHRPRAGFSRDDVISRLLVPGLTAAYLIGVLVLLGRLSLGLRNGSILRRGACPVEDAELLAIIGRQVNALQLKVTPAVAYCEQLAIPIVVGVFRPTILLPFSLASRLTPDQVAAVLTHELAHIRRCDHLVNLLQRLVESLLFFHPAVWWVSHRMRIEREHCCDDIVVELGAEPLEYAASLLDLAEQGHQRRRTGRLGPVMALQATGSSRIGHRIRRLVGVTPTPSMQLTRGGATLCVVLTLAVLGGWASWNRVSLAVPPGELTANEDNPPADLSNRAEERPANEPRAIVQQWIDLMRMDRGEDAAALTRESVNVRAHYGMNDLNNKDNVRIARSLGHESAAAVVTNVIEDNYGRDRAFVFWLVRRDGEWRINASGMDDPEKIDEQLRGFMAVGDVRWHVSGDDIAGIWRCGPGTVAGSGGKACFNRLELRDDDTFTLEEYDPGGDATESTGTWRLEQDRLVLDSQQDLVSRVRWIGRNRLTLVSVDGKSRTRYERAEDSERQAAAEQFQQDDASANTPGQPPGDAAVGDDVAGQSYSFGEIREVASQWIDLVRSDQRRESWELTTKSLDVGGHGVLAELSNKDELRVQRSLGNDSVAMVITNSVQDSGRDRAIAFRLVRRDGVWLIDACNWDDPENIDERLRGFRSHGDIRWHVTESDILGTWLAAWFVRDEYTFLDDGTLKNTYRTTETVGSWQLRGDQFTWMLGEESATEPLDWLTVVWVSEEFFQVRWPDRRSVGFTRMSDSDENAGESVFPNDSARSASDDE